MVGDSQEARALATRVRPKDEVTGATLDPGRRLIWRRTAPFAPEFELRQGDAVFGEMEPAGRDGVDATGECLGRSLELSLDVRFMGKVRVTSQRSMAEEVGPAFTGWFFGWGWITTSAGELLRWRHGLVRLYDHILSDAAGKELLRLRPTFLRLGRTETRVLPSRSGWARPDLAELILLTWFLRIHSETRKRRVFGNRRGR